MDGWTAAPGNGGGQCCGFQNNSKRAFSFEKIQCLRRLTREGIPERVSRSWHLAFRSVALVLKITAYFPSLSRCLPACSFPSFYAGNDKQPIQILGSIPAAIFYFCFLKKSLTFFSALTSTFASSSERFVITALIISSWNLR